MRTETTEQQWIDAGFTIEKLGSVTIYSRPVSDYVLRMCALLDRGKLKRRADDPPIKEVTEK